MYGVVGFRAETLAQTIYKSIWQPTSGYCPNLLAVIDLQAPELRAAKRMSLLQSSFERCAPETAFLRGS